MRDSDKLNTQNIFFSYIHKRIQNTSNVISFKQHSFSLLQSARLNSNKNVVLITHKSQH